MTRGGRLYELQISVPPISVSGGSPSPLLPTPGAADGKRGPAFNSAAHAGEEDLVTVVVRLYRETSEMLPKPEALFKTPTANLGSNGAAQHPDQRTAGGHGPTLADEVCFLLHVEPEEQAPAGPHSPPQWWGKFAAAVHRWEVLTLSLPRSSSAQVNGVGRRSGVPGWRQRHDGLCADASGLPGCHECVRRAAAAADK